MDRRDAEKKCSNAGDYLVRYSDRQNKYVLTVNWNGQGRHFVIQEIPDVSIYNYYYYKNYCRLYSHNFQFHLNTVLFAICYHCIPKVTAKQFMNTSINKL